MKLEIISKSAEQTAELGKIFSRALDWGDIVLMSGDLGGGKTTFICGIADGLGIGEAVSSPSFTLINEYQTGGKKLIHADLYRLNGIRDISGLELEDYVYDPHSIICIEWGEKIKGCIRKDFVIIDFSYVMQEEQRRKIVFKSSNTYWKRKLEDFGKMVGPEGSL